MLTGKLAELDKAVRRPADRCARPPHVDSELAALRTDAGRSASVSTRQGRGGGALKGAAKAADLAPLATKLAVLERDVQIIPQGRGRPRRQRHRQCQRCCSRSSSPTSSAPWTAARATRGAGGAPRRWPAARSNFAAAGALHAARACRPSRSWPSRSARRPTPCIDAEAEPADSSMVDRLLSGARSIVRVRKAGHAADDTSLEAVIGRMETALKDGRLADVLAQGQEAAAQGGTGRRGLDQEGRGAPSRRPGDGRGRSRAQVVARRRHARAPQRSARR